MSNAADGPSAAQHSQWAGLPATVTSVRHLWVDHGAVIRGKAARAAGPVHMSQAQMAIPVHADVVVPAAGLLPVHDVELVPDWESIRVLPFHPTHAAVACDLYDDGVPWDHCPRGFLRRMDAAARSAGLDVLVGVELEFTLLRRDDDDATAGWVRTVDETAFCMDAAFDDAGSAIDDIVSALEAQGLVVAQFHPESGPGQWEISLAPLPLLAAADAVIALRQTIRGVAAKHHLRPSFLPLLEPLGAGGGMHLHISLCGDQPGLGAQGEAFCAGMLEHLGELLAVTAPSPISLMRFRPHYWVGAFAGWGLANKEAPLRVIPAADGTWRDVEFKAADGTANPYLALGCVVAAGLDGVQQNLTLPAPLQGDPGRMSEHEREAVQAWPLAGDPRATLERFAASDVCRRAMGEGLLGSYVAVRAADLDATQEWSFEAIRDLWLSRM